MTDAELVQELRDDADRLELQHQMWTVADEMRLAAARIEAGAGLIAACEKLVEAADNEDFVIEEGGAGLRFAIAMARAAAVKYRSEQ